MNGIFLMLAADVVFALMAASTKSLGLGLPSVEVVFIRSVTSAFVVGPVLWKQGQSFRAKEPRLLWSRGFIGYIALQSYFWALPQLKLGTAVMLNYTAPIFAVLFSFILLKELPTAMARLSLLFSFLGVWLLSSAEFGGNPLPLLAGLLSGIFAGAVHVMIRQSQKKDTPLLIVFYFTVSCTIASGLLLFKTGWISPSPLQWVILLAITITSLAGQVLLTYSLKAAPVWVVSPFGYLTPVLGLFLGVFFWGEIPTTANIVGGVLVILCGTLMLSYFGKKLNPLSRS